MRVKVPDLFQGALEPRQTSPTYPYKAERLGTRMLRCGGRARQGGRASMVGSRPGPGPWKAPFRLARPQKRRRAARRAALADVGGDSRADFFFEGGAAIAEHDGGRHGVGRIGPSVP
jgi:hypothetical protein